MAVKVGDVVRYQGRDVRILRMDRRVRLSYFGDINERFNDSDVVEFNQAPKFKVGDEVTICEIPKEEQTHYGSGWMGEMTNMIGKTYTVTGVREDSNAGRRVKLDGFWFQTYHLETEHVYDMI